jgi:hypothetical protein
LIQARDAAQAALADLALEQNLAPVRKGARVIREIAWRLREIGADGRICDLIDSQVGAIEGAAGRMAPADLASALSGAFDQIEQKIAAFDAGEAAAASPVEASPAPETPPPQTADAAPVAVAQAQAHAETSAEAGETVPTSGIAHPAEAVAADAVPSDESIDAFDATDEAMLDMVAMEMAAPDSDDAYEPKLDGAEPDESEIHANETSDPSTDELQAIVASYEIDVTFPDSSNVNGTATALPTVTPLQSVPVPEPKPVAELKPLAEPKPMAELMPVPDPALSLGSSLIANGIVPRPRAARPDPLAPIRRMSQTEKIAFFS